MPHSSFMRSLMHGYVLILAQCTISLMKFKWYRTVNLSHKSIEEMGIIDTGLKIKINAFF